MTINVQNNATVNNQTPTDSTQAPNPLAGMTLEQLEAMVTPQTREEVEKDRQSFLENADEAIAKVRKLYESLPEGKTKEAVKGALEDAVHKKEQTNDYFKNIITYSLSAIMQMPGTMVNNILAVQSGEFSQMKLNEVIGVIAQNDAKNLSLQMQAAAQTLDNYVQHGGPDGGEGTDQGKINDYMTAFNSLSATSSTFNQTDTQNINTVSNNVQGTASSITTCFAMVQTDTKWTDAAGTMMAQSSVG
jgi:hypothetical protein